MIHFALTLGLSNYSQVHLGQKRETKIDFLLCQLVILPLFFFFLEREGTLGEGGDLMDILSNFSNLIRLEFCKKSFL